MTLDALIRRPASLCLNGAFRAAGGPLAAGASA